jgi:hypothetical protein
MPNKEAITREVERGKKLFETYARHLEAERQRDRLFFPSLAPGNRGPVSPLGNVSPDWEWSGRKP